MVLSAWIFLCVLQMYFYSQKMKIVKNDMLPAVGVWRHVTSDDQRNNDEQTLTGCISSSNWPILILFVANCSWNLLDSY